MNSRGSSVTQHSGTQSSTSLLLLCCSLNYRKCLSFHLSSNPLVIVKSGMPNLQTKLSVFSINCLPVRSCQLSAQINQYSRASSTTPPLQIHLFHSFHQKFWRFGSNLFQSLWNLFRQNSGLRSGLCVCKAPCTSVTQYII